MVARRPLRTPSQGLTQKTSNQLELRNEELRNTLQAFAQGVSDHMDCARDACMRMFSESYETKVK